jgi:hypothetical protein
MSQKKPLAGPVSTLVLKYLAHLNLALIRQAIKGKFILAEPNDSPIL